MFNWDIYQAQSLRVLYNGKMIGFNGIAVMGVTGLNETYDILIGL